MNGRRPLLQMQDMLAFARDAVELLGEADAQMLASNKMRYYAVIRAVEMIGEAAAQVSREDQAIYSGIPWREAIATRHRLIHGYGDINPERLVQTVRESLPALIAALEVALD